MLLFQPSSIVNKFHLKQQKAASFFENFASLIELDGGLSHFLDEDLIILSLQLLLSLHLSLQDLDFLFQLFLNPGIVLLLLLEQLL